MIKQEYLPSIFRIDCSGIKQHQFKWQFFRFVIFNYYLIEAVLASSFYSMYQLTVTSLMPLNILFFIYMFLDFILKIGFTPRPEFKKLQHYRKVSKVLKYYLFSKLLIFDIIFLVLFIGSYILPFDVSRFFRLIILVKLIDVVDFNNVIYEKIHIYPLFRKVYTIFKISYIILLFSHYFGTWFYLIDQLLINAEFYGTPAIGNQVYYQMNLLAFTPIEQLDNWGRYLYGLYFMVSLITTIAYGDIIGKNAFQEAYVSVLMILSTISLGLILEQFMDFVRFDSMGLYDFIKNYNSLKTCMDDSQVPYSVQNRVRSYLVYSQYQKKYHAHEEVAEKLTQKLQSDLKSQSYAEGIKLWIIPCFPELKDQVEQICNICNLISFQAQTDIYEQLQTVQTASQCCFLYKLEGLVEQYIQLKKSRIRLPTKNRKQFNLSRLLLNFNMEIAYDSDQQEQQEFQHDQQQEQVAPKKYHLINANRRGLKSIKISQFVLLDAEEFYQFVNTKKNWVKRIKLLKEQIISKDIDYRLLDDSCQLCRSQNLDDHPIEECPTCHLSYNQRTSTCQKISDLIYLKQNRKKVKRKQMSSKKRLGISLFQKNIFSFLIKPPSQTPQQKQMIVNIFKNIIDSMKDSNKRFENECDSSYDPNGLSQAYHLELEIN